MDKEQTIVEHLTELRQRIIWALAAVLIAVVVAVVFSDPVFRFIMRQAQVDGVTLVQHTYSDAFMTQFRLAIIAGLVLAFPVVLYQIVAFILPALKPSEQRLLYIGLPFATVMFALGWAFGWFVVIPVSRGFFLEISNGVGIVNQMTPSNYLSFVMSICNPLGIAFELPLLVLILARIGLISHTFLSRIRKYAFLVLLIIAAVLSPPDIVSMIIFMVPLYGLYEFSILLARFARPKDER